VVYDITKQSTYDNVNKWIEDLKNQAEPDIVIMLVGNKMDLTQKNNSARYATSLNPSLQRKIQREEAENFAKTRDLKF
jgi:GTPase SAR1 family protein